MAVAFTHLPIVGSNLNEGGLGVAGAARGPRTLVLGTANQGQSNWPYVVQTTASAASEFGSGGTLTRGMYEARTAGAENVILYRVGATPAILSGVGDTTGVAGYTIETLRRDDDAGGLYTIYYDDGTDRIVIWNASSGLVVYDNDSTDPIDLGEVTVSGSRATGGGPDIAGPSVGFALEDVVSLGHTGTSYTAGTDGATPSRMELYEYYYKAYKELIIEDFDWVIPMDIYLDDKNIVDGYSFSASYLAGIVSGGTYPTAASSDDILGKLFVEEYQGDFYFFWDLDGDGVADLYPNGVGSASSTTKIDGTSLSTADFHEINFAYQLAYFCHEVSENSKYCLGGIGVLPPASLSLADISVWVGKLPTYTTRSDGTKYIRTAADNGTGLLGNKFKSGTFAYRAGEAYGGFILTDSEFLDGTAQTDDRDYPIDLGKYLSITSAYVRLFNAFDTTGRGYVTTAAPTYIGFATSLDEQTAPTNKQIRGLQRVFGINARRVDDLAGAGYVHIYEKPKGLTVSDAPTGALPSSDYRRLTTMRIVKRTVGAVRDAADPFLGNSFDATRKAALNTAITQKLDRLVTGGYIQRYVVSITQTARQMVIGEADVELTIAPAWELRRITLNIALAPQ
jgi:hypothetical protein